MRQKGRGLVETRRHSMEPKGTAACAAASFQGPDRALPPGIYRAWEINPIKTIQNIRTQASSHSSRSLRFAPESLLSLAIISVPSSPSGRKSSRKAPVRR